MQTLRRTASPHHHVEHHKEIEVPKYIVVCPAWVEEFDGIPVAVPGQLADPLEVGAGQLDSIADELRAMAKIIQATDEAEAKIKFLNEARNTVNLTVQGKDTNFYTLELYHNKSRPVGQYWKLGVGLDYMHPNLPQNSGGMLLPGIPYELGNSGRSFQVFAPIVVVLG